MMRYLDKLEEAKKVGPVAKAADKFAKKKEADSIEKTKKDYAAVYGKPKPKLKESASREAGLSRAQHRKMMLGKRSVLGQNPNPDQARGFERGATGELKRQAAVKKKRALDAKKPKMESYQQFGDILAEAMFGKIRTKAANKLDKFSRKQHRKGESDEASGKEGRAAVRGRAAHAAGKLAQKVRPKDED